jgi:dimethylhistidine N-methyltransferase
VAAVERALELRRQDAGPLGDRPLRAAVLAGLRQRPKRISPVWFYDERGSCLFDEICELPEYYLTRVELAILHRWLPEMAARLEPELCVIEPGSGSGTKTHMLLEALPRPAAYVPVDIACEHLEAAAARLRLAHPRLRVHPICADFTAPFAIPEDPAFDRRLIYFPGSTIGNFDRYEAVALLANLRATARGGSMLIGVDLVKDPAVLLSAYDDAAGVTAAFNRNALVHLNRRLGTDFDPAAFAHRAVWNAAESRIEMHLVSRRRQLVRVGDEFVSLGQDEAIVSEYSHKYTLAAFAAQARAAGWSVWQIWTDPGNWFSVQQLLPHRHITSDEARAARARVPRPTGIRSPR